MISLRRFQRWRVRHRHDGLERSHSLRSRCVTRQKGDAGGEAREGEEIGNVGEAREGEEIRNVGETREGEEIGNVGGRGGGGEGRGCRLRLLRRRRLLSDLRFFLRFQTSGTAFMALGRRLMASAALTRLL